MCSTCSDAPKASAWSTFITTPSPEIGSPPKLENPRITLVDAAAFLRASKLEGSQTFQLDLSTIDTSARLVKVTFHPVDLENVPKEYHDFADMFSKSKADTLGPHRPYDLNITLEDGTKMPHPPLYSLSNSELETLRAFLDEHLNMGFIRASRSPHGAPILFV